MTLNDVIRSVVSAAPRSWIDGDQGSCFPRQREESMTSIDVDQDEMIDVGAAYPSEPTIRTKLIGIEVLVRRYTPGA